MPSSVGSIPYRFIGPFMDRSRPSSQLKPGRFGYLAGVDGRFSGGLRKYWGNTLAKELTDIEAGLTNITFFEAVSFQKGTTSGEYRGFVVRSGAGTTDQKVTLFYYDTGTSTWGTLAVHAAGGATKVTSTTRMWADVSGKFLLVAVEGKSTKTVYYTGSSLVAVDMGAGDFATEAGMAAMTDSGTLIAGPGKTAAITSIVSVGTTVTVTTAIDHNLATGAKVKVSGTTNFDDTETAAITSTGDRTFTYVGPLDKAEETSGTIKKVNGTSYYLNGEGTYRIAFRFYSSTRDIYSALSAPVTVKLGGSDDDPFYGQTIDFPDSDDSTFDYTDGSSGFSDMFDTVEVFRTINLGSYDAFDGSIFYKESTIDKDGNWGGEGKDVDDWNALTVTIGTLRDESLVVQDQYNPDTDVMIAVPNAGAIGTWDSLTFISRAITTRNGVDTYWSDPGTLSPEYFTDENMYRAKMSDGKPLRYIAAGDVLFILHPQAIVYVEKEGTKLRFSRQHTGRGLTSVGAAHTIGNDMIMMSPLGVVVVNATDAKMQIFTTLDREIFSNWADDLDSIESCYDSYMNASFFLNPERDEVICVWWTTKAVSMLTGTNFIGCSPGTDITNSNRTRGYFITSTGRIVYPDTVRSGYGNMLGLDGDSYTLNGTVTSCTAATSLTDSEATYHASLVGALLYVTSGDNAGESTTISAVNTGTKTLTLAVGLSSDLAIGDTYAVAPVPFSAKLWPVPTPQRKPGEPITPLYRKIVTALCMDVQGLVGFSANANDFWRIGAYRNGSSTIETGDKSTTTIDMDDNPSDSTGHLNIDGIEVEPYVEQIASGVDFELTNAEISVTISQSKKVSD